MNNIHSSRSAHLRRRLPSSRSLYTFADALDITATREPQTYSTGVSERQTIDFQNLIINSSTMFKSDAMASELSYRYDDPTAGIIFISDEMRATADRVNPIWVNSNNSWATWLKATKTAFTRAKDTITQQTNTSPGKLRVDRLVTIQTALGLPTLALAKIFNISRQGLYKWLDSSNDITMQEANHKRILSVEHLAKLWLERSKAPISTLAYEPLANGRSVVEMLSADVLVESDIAQAFDELLIKLNSKPKSLSQQLTEAGYTRRPSGRSTPDDE